MAAMPDPPTSVDWPAVSLGLIGTVGGVVELIQGAWLLAGVIFLGSIVTELLVVLLRRRKPRRAQTP